MPSIRAVSYTHLRAHDQGAMAPRGGFTGPGLSVSTVAEANKMSDDQPVVLVGQIQQSLGDEKYLFKDASGTITIEIDDEDWRLSLIHISEPTRP